MPKTKQPKKKTYKLDIFGVLKHLNGKNHNFYQSLSDDEQKALQPFVLMRWMTGTTSPSQVFFVNELVNPFVFEMAKHKELLVDLLTVCPQSNDPNRRMRWIKAKTTKNSSKTVKLIAEYFNYSTKDAKDILPLLDDETILSYAEQMGYQPDEIREIKTEIKNRATVVE
jgi:hypothetical protein